MKLFSSTYRFFFTLLLGLLFLGFIELNAQDIGVAKTVDDNNPQEGDTVTFTITMDKSGGGRPVNIQIADQLPSGLTFVSSTASRGNYNAGTGIWDLGSVRGEPTETLSITVRVKDGTGGGTITNTATFTGNDNNEGNDSDSASLSVQLSGGGVPPANCNDLPSLVFENGTLVSGSAGQPGAVYRFNNVLTGTDATVTITNINNAILVNPDQIASGGSDEAFQPQIEAQNKNLAQGFIDFRIDFLEAGTNTPITVDRFAVTALDVDGDNQDTREFVGFQAGESYTIESVSNLNVGFTDPFNTFEAQNSDVRNGINPNDTENIVYLRYRDVSSFRYRGGLMDPTNTSGTSAQRLFSYDFNPCLINNFNNPATTTINADVGITKTVDNATPAQGATINYTLNVQNNGPQQATGIVVRDPLPDGVSFVSSSVGQGSYNASTGRWNIGTLDNGSSAALTIAVTVDQGTIGTSINNIARVDQLNQNDPNGANQADNISVDVSAEISGVVFEDITGDALDDGDNTLNDGAGDQQGRANVQVLLFRDGDDGLPDGSDDTFVESTTTDANGEYSFSAAQDNYWVAIDSRSGSLTNGTTWAEQTYASSGSFCSDGAGGTTKSTQAGPCFGGRRGNQSDNLPASPTAASLANAEHLIEVDLSQGNSTDNNFGFSFNVVSDVRDGDDDGGAARSVQGSLRQFIQNANAIAGANAMRFVPAVPLNQGSWWQVAIASQLPDITGASTTIDGTAFALTDGITERNTNTGIVGSGGTVGVDELSLNTFERKELEINLSNQGSGAFTLNSAGALTVREISIYNNNSIRVENASTVVFENNFIGPRADGTDPGGSLRLGIGVDFRGSASYTAIVQDNYIAHTNHNGIGSRNSNITAQVRRNEIFRAALSNSTADGIDVLGSWTIEQNLFHENGGSGSQPERSGAGVELGRTSGLSTNNTIRNNSFHSNAVSGINILNTVSNTLIEKNVIFNNGTNYQGSNPLLGAGIKLTAPDTNGQEGIRITQNSIYDNFGLGIDLVGTYDGSGDSGQADGVTQNDLNDGDTGPNGLFNFPIIEDADLQNGALTVTGFARPGTIIEVFIADEDPSGFGEGRTYLFTVAEGSAQDNDGTSGSYSGLINGEDMGTDITNRFEFTVNAGNSLNIGDLITATGTDANNNNTSEFNGAVQVTGAGTTVSGFVYNDANTNAARDTDEDGIEGVTVVLYNESADNCRSVQTDANGAYTFDQVTDGDYRIIESANEATPEPGTCPPAEEDPAGFVSTTSNTLEIAVTGTQVTEQNFGDFDGSRLTGVVFQDDGTGGGTANDGVQNGTEAGIAKTNIRLTDGSGNALSPPIQTQTNGAGRYTFFIPDALSGSPLRVVETNFDNYVSTGGDAGTTGGGYDRSSDATTFTPVSGTEYTGAKFAVVPDNSFNTDGKQNTTAGSTVFFPHTFVARTAGEVSLSTTNTGNPENSGWKQTIFRDNNCNGEIDGSDQPISNPVAVTLGENVCIVVRAATPSGVPQGSSNVITVTANFNYTNASPELSRGYTRTDRVNITDASGSGLKITKQVDQAQALPGDTLTYTITYTNNGSEPLDNLEITDSTPAYTGFTSASCAETLPNNLTDCTISAPPVGEQGPVVWTFRGSLAPGSSGTVIYQVTIQN